MAASADRSSNIVKEIDELLEKDQLTTRTGLRFAFSALRDAIALLSDAKEEIETISKKVDAMWTFYRVAMWAATIFGGLVIAFSWSLLTGQAHITFGNP